MVIDIEGYVYFSIDSLRVNGCKAARAALAVTTACSECLNICDILFCSEFLVFIHKPPFLMPVRKNMYVLGNNTVERTECNKEENCHM